MANNDPVIYDLEIMSNAGSYLGWIYGRINKYLGQRIVELGAGTGNITRLLTDRELIVTVDNHEPCIKYLKNKFADRDNIIPEKVDISTKELLKLKHYRPDTVICMNVLEHIKDDMSVTSRVFDILETGGMLILLVPAFNLLYGSIDYTLGHYRRYSRKDIREVLVNSGFALKEIFYLNSIGVIGWFINNRILKLEEESKAQVLFFDRYIVPWLKYVENHVRTPLGLSLIAVGEKAGPIAVRNT